MAKGLAEGMALGLKTMRPESDRALNQTVAMANLANQQKQLGWAQEDREIKQLRDRAFQAVNAAKAGDWSLFNKLDVDGGIKVHDVTVPGAVGDDEVLVGGPGMAPRPMKKADALKRAEAYLDPATLYKMQQDRLAAQQKERELGILDAKNDIAADKNLADEQDSQRDYRAKMAQIGVLRNYYDGLLDDKEAARVAKKSDAQVAIVTKLASTTDVDGNTIINPELAALTFRFLDDVEKESPDMDPRRAAMEAASRARKYMSELGSKKTGSGGESYPDIPPAKGLTGTLADTAHFSGKAFDEANKIGPGIGPEFGMSRGIRPRR